MKQSQSDLVKILYCVLSVTIHSCNECEHRNTCSCVSRCECVSLYYVFERQTICCSSDSCAPHMYVFMDECMDVYLFMCVWILKQRDIVP